MREIHIQVANENRDAVTPVLDEHDIDYTSIADDDESHVFFPLPTAAVSTVLDDLQTADLDDDAYTVMRKAEFAQTPNFTDLQAEYAASIRKLSKWELHGKIREIQWPYQLYYLGTVLSVIAATAGLLIDQPALLIGAMIIAPQASSALAAPAGVMLGDWDLFTHSIKEQALSLGLAVVAASLFGWFLKWSGFVPSDLAITQIELVSLRLSPTLLSTVGALISGIVGAFGYTTEQSASLIGVMIAAALIPAAAAIGLAVAWAAPVFGFGALLLLLVNVLAINIGAFLTLTAMGYQPKWLATGDSLRESIPSERRLLVYVTLACVLVATVGTTYFTGTNIEFTREVNEEVEATLSQPAYDELAVSGVQTAYGGHAVTTSTTTVTVSLTRESDRPHPGLAAELERNVERRTNQDVRVVVEFTESQAVDSSAT